MDELGRRTGAAAAGALLAVTLAAGSATPAVAGASRDVASSARPAPGFGAGDPATSTAAGAQALGRPVATVGTFDCGRRQVALTLDNSRSTQSTTYAYEASFQRPLRPPYEGVDATRFAEVGAGERTVVVLPLRDDARTVAAVHLPDGGTVHSAGTCGQAPAAFFGPGDCDTPRMGLTLDNGHSSRSTRYRWTMTDPAGLVRSETVDVAAGALEVLHLPLVTGSWVAVDVTVDGRGLVASSDRRACGEVTVHPHAAFGAVDCGTLSAPVLLDNSRSTARVRVRLPAHQDVVLAAGETRSFRLQLPARNRLAVTSEEFRAPGVPADLAVVSTASCGRRFPHRK